MLAKIPNGIRATRRTRGSQFDGDPDVLHK